MKIVLALVISAFAFAASSAQSLNPTNVTVGSNDLARPRKVATFAMPTPAAIAELERTTFDLLNAKRKERGLRALVWSDSVAAVAREHSVDMATMDYFSHKDMNGRYVSDRADSMGLSKWRAIGENIAFNRGFSDPISRTVELWMNSASHRQNLLDDHWKESAVGIAVANDGSYFFTQVFLDKK
ncbi:MAG: CAP domain-containing protein [Acidobacteria bacterium]|nr:CAP domain-containing protein [Acidobacteriota bacterium]